MPKTLHKKSDWKPSEADIAAVVSAWLIANCWDCYYEVDVSGGRADIVAIRHSLVWIVETKVRLNCEVLTQCVERLHEPVSGVIAATPRLTMSTAKHMWVYQDYMKQHGIGFAEVHVSQPIGDGKTYGSVNLKWSPALRRIDTMQIRSRCKPEHKTNTPGTAGSYWTPFKTLVQKLQAELQEGPIGDAMNLDCLREYKPRAPAEQRRALTSYLESGFIPGWGVERREKRLWIVRQPSTQEHPTP